MEAWFLRCSCGEAVGACCGDLSSRYILHDSTIAPSPTHGGSERIKVPPASQGAPLVPRRGLSRDGGISENYPSFARERERERVLVYVKCACLIMGLHVVQPLLG